MSELILLISEKSPIISSPEVILAFALHNPAHTLSYPIPVAGMR